MTSKNKPTEGRRVSVDLTSAASAEIDRLREITGLTTADIFRHGLSLFRLYVTAKSEQKDFAVIDRQKDGHRTQIELPVEISAAAKK